MKCSDCGFPAPEISERRLKVGSAVREPGEHVCPGCLASRTVLVRKVMALPDSLDQIQAGNFGRIK